MVEFLSLATELHIFHVYYIIVINIRGQIENRPLQNRSSAGRTRLTAGCLRIISPAADWFLELSFR